MPKKVYNTYKEKHNHKIYKEVYTLSFMHLYVLTRGVKNRVDEWENDLGAEWLPLHYKMPDDKIVEGRIKLAIREVKLHEIVFPKEYEEHVMSLVNPGDGSNFGKWGKLAKKIVSAFMLKKPLSKWKENNKINADGISCIALGTKEDVMNFDIPKSIQEVGIEPQENL